MKRAPIRKAGEIVTIPKVRGSWRLIEPTGSHAQGGYAIWHAESVETPGRRTTVRESNMSGHTPAPRKIVGQRDIPKLSSGSSVDDEPRDDKGRWTK